MADYYNDYAFLLITDDQTDWDRGSSRYHLRSLISITVLLTGSSKTT